MTYKYQIPTCIHEIRSAVHLGDVLLDILGNAPEIWVQDITTGKAVPWKKVYKITGLDEVLVDELVSLRMQANSIWGMLIERRRKKVLDI